ncbi:MAG TPA: twin-arginine translocase subunit TatC [Fimbriimonadaceae bacterium]|jgi:sec-independent protein translocase protein TatC
MPVSLGGASKKSRSQVDDPEDFRATLVQHLDELRARIVRSLWILMGGWLAGWYLERPAYAAIDTYIGDPIRRRMPPGSTFHVMFTHATEPFLLKVKLSFMIGLVITLPIIAITLWGFVAPGLKKVERKVVASVSPVSLLLFLMGCVFCWFTLPSAYIWFTSYFDEFPGAGLNQDPAILVSFTLKMLLAFGVGFQLPLVVFVLGKIGLLSPDTLIRNWRQATVGIFLISAIVTPSNDPLTMLMMAVPLSLLFVISVYAVRWTTRKQLRDADKVLDDLD